MQVYIQNYMKAHGYGIDDYVPCEHCDKLGLVVRAVDVHHIVSRAQGGTDEASNLQALCRACHEREHGGCK